MPKPIRELISRRGSRRGRPCWKPVCQQKEVSPGVRRDETPDEAWERTRLAVRHYTAIGYPQEVIARLVDPSCEPDTLRKYFAFELQNGKAIADARVAGTAYYLALCGREPSMTRFWLRSRLGWRDVGDVKAQVAMPIRFQKIEGDDW